MESSDILKHPAKVLSQDQREFYFNEGYLLVENLISPDWLTRINEAIDELLERSRTLKKSDAIFDLEPRHSHETPRLRRVSNIVEQHPIFWELAAKSKLTDVAEDLCGPDVKFHHSKLNFKCSEGGEEVKWHQDIGFWPHTNYTPLTMGLYLNDVAEEQGPLQVLPESHRGEIYSQYNSDGEWIGCLGPEELELLNLKNAVSLMGSAGSVTIHNCRTLHASKKNHSPISRPLLLNAFSSADAFPYTFNPIPSKYYGHVVRGKRALVAHHDALPCAVPPDWSGGYGSIYTAQQEENVDIEQYAYK